MLSVYVTGTDTGIGKTHACRALLTAQKRGGVRSIGMKPVASGCERRDGAWRSDDALALMDAAAVAADYALVNPYALPEPTAPEIAANEAGTLVKLAPLCAAYAELAAQADCVVVEGVGGWGAPLSDALDQSALAHALDLPVLLVVGLRLGCINHARLTARAITADGCRLLGWIGNRIDPELAHSGATLAILQRVIDAPCLGVLRHGAPDPAGLDLAVLRGR